METSSALLAPCAGNSPITGEFPSQRPVTRSFDVFFDLYLNKRFSKQSWINGWVNNREAGDLRRHRGHYDVIVMYCIYCALQFVVTWVVAPIFMWYHMVWILWHPTGFKAFINTVSTFWNIQIALSLILYLYLLELPYNSSWPCANIEGLAQDCGNSSVLAMELRQSCAYHVIDTCFCGTCNN